MSRSIHETRSGYWRQAAFNYSDPEQRKKVLGNYYYRLRQKKFYKINEQRRRQIHKAGLPTYVTEHFVRPGQEQQTHTPEGRGIGNVDASRL